MKEKKNKKKDQMTLKQCQNNIDYLLKLKKFTYLRINCRIEKKNSF